MTSINPGLRMVSRSPDSVQIGVGTGGIILTGLGAEELLFLDALRQGVPDGEVFVHAQRLGVDDVRARDICTKLHGVLFRDDQLHSHGFKAERLLAERAAMLGIYQERFVDQLRHRQEAVVHVVGLGRTGAALAAALASAGVGTLLLEDDLPVTASDVGPGFFTVPDIGTPRSLAVRRHIQRIDPSCHGHLVHDGGTGGPSVRSLSLAMVVGHDSIPATLAARFLAVDKPHLFVLLREQDGTVGPLVVPGQTACSECVERHRSSHDEQWLDVCGQLASVQNTHRRHALENTALALTIAGTAAAHALLYLDGLNQPSSWSSVLTFHSDNARWSRQPYEIHPECGCQWQSQPLARISNTASP